MRSRGIVTALIGIGFLIAGLTGCGGPFGIKSARRTLQYNQGSSDVQVRDPQQDVFLILELRDPKPELFEKMKSSKPYFTAGEQRFEVHYSRYEEGQETRNGRLTPKTRTILLAVVVPRALEAFQLHVEGYPPKSFKAEHEIHDQLKI